MNKNSPDASTESKAITAAPELLGQALQSLDTFLKSAKRGRAALNQAKARFADRPLDAIEKLTAGWQPADLTHLTEANRCVDSLGGLLKPLRAEQVSRFQAELAQICLDNRRTLKVLPGGFAVGPFAIVVDELKLSARVTYAKLDVAKDLPLSAGVVMKQVMEQEAEVLGEIPPAKELAAQFAQAVKVACVRQDGKLPGGSVRVELPRAYYEMILIRQGGGTRALSRVVKAYSIARFIVELVTLIRSETNGQSEQFRLETAVLENARNMKKAFFVPNDLTVGYGEGTYYQALILTNP